MMNSGNDKFGFRPSTCIDNPRSQPQLSTSIASSVHQASTSGFAAVSSAAQFHSLSSRSRDISQSGQSASLAVEENDPNQGFFFRNLDKRTRQCDINNDYNDSNSGGTNIGDAQYGEDGHGRGNDGEPDGGGNQFSGSCTHASALTLNNDTSFPTWVFPAKQEANSWLATHHYHPITNLRTLAMKTKGTQSLV
jgi:hypothetical protein